LVNVFTERPNVQAGKKPTLAPKEVHIRKVAGGDGEGTNVPTETLDACPLGYTVAAVSVAVDDMLIEHWGEGFLPGLAHLNTLKQIAAAKIVADLFCELLDVKRGGGHSRKVIGSVSA
jgi:hypothetical protein